MSGLAIAEPVLILGDRSNSSPGLAYLNGRYFLAWAGQGNNQINVMFSTSPDFRNVTRALSEETCLGSPAVASHGGLIWIAWTGIDDAHSLNLMSFDGGFLPKTSLAAASISAPSLTSVNGQLFIAWTGTDPDHKLNCARVEFGT